MTNLSGFTQTHLNNSLKVMLQEVRTSPIISFWVWYAVGSRNEKPGKTGISHWVEHLQFKGTARHSSQEMDHAIAKSGGFWNAFTSADWTTYFETMPSNYLEYVLGLEADRMNNSLFDSEAVEAERTVILSEREGAENDPEFRLGEQVQLASFQSHPYRNEVLGSKPDLLAMTRDDLYEHYRSNYHPAKATLCIAGDFKTIEALDLLEKHFGAIQNGTVESSTPSPEDTLDNGTKIEMEGPGETTFLQIAYRSPAANTQDFFAFTILDSLLAGPSSLNMFGSGGIGNRTSRLYLALVEKQYTVSLSGGLNATIDPSTYTLQLTAHPRRKPDEILNKLDEQIDRVLTRAISRSELEKTVKQARALFAYGSDNITNLGFWMGYANAFADYSWFLNYVDRLAQVTPQDVKNVARKYLQPENRVIGIYHGKDRG